jgi:hypothetical protein
MPANLEFIEDGHIGLTTITDPWEINDLMGIVKKGAEFRDQAKHIVHSLVDLSAIQNIPSQIIQAPVSVVFKHRNSGYMAAVGAKAYEQRILETLSMLNGGKEISFFQTYDEALAYLRDIIRKEQSQGIEPEIAP